MRLKFKKLDPNAVLPVYATEGSWGMDICACLPLPITLQGGEAAKIPTGIAVELPDNMEAQIRPRSGLAAKHAVTVLNSPGTIDADFRGQIQVLLINHSHAPFTITNGMRIAQMVVSTAVVKCWPEFVEDIDETVRGEGGFGSTGLHVIQSRIHERDETSHPLDMSGWNFGTLTIFDSLDKQIHDDLYATPNTPVERE